MEIDRRRLKKFFNKEKHFMAMFSWTHLIVGRFGCVTLPSVLPPSLTTLPPLAPSPPVRGDPHTPTLPAPGLPTCRTSAWRTHLPRDGPRPPGSRRALLGRHLLHNPYRCLELPDVPAAPCTRIETSESRTLSWEISKTPAPKTLRRGGMQWMFLEWIN